MEEFKHMAMFIGRNRKARVTYGFDEIALVPGNVTINPGEVDISFEIPNPNGGSRVGLAPSRPTRSARTRRSPRPVFGGPTFRKRPR